jgi:hypothetical protein
MANLKLIQTNLVWKAGLLVRRLESLPVASYIAKNP